MSKTALVTGITGQDASFLSELLLEKGYKVFGMRRRTSVANTSRISHIINDIELVDGDLCDTSSLLKVIKHCKPDEVYNLAAQSFVKTSFSQPEVTAQITALGVIRLLEALRSYSPHSKFYQASSSEMFGNSKPPQSETTNFYPRSPYGISKLFAHWATVNYRERENDSLFACSGILFNHESPKRGAEFVTQKIAQGVAAIKLGHQKKLYLGNLDAKRDWGHAKDFTRAMYLMLQQPKADDYVIATGEAHTVRQFADLAFSRVGLDYREFVEVDPQFYRPTEVDYLLGSYAKAKAVLGWEPTISFIELVYEMVDHAIAHPEEWLQNIQK